MTARTPLTTLDAVVEFVLFVRDDGFTALRATTQDSAPLTAVGPELAGARPGEGLRLTGRWTQHRRHGEQFTVEECERRPPAGVPAIRRWPRPSPTASARTPSPSSTAIQPASRRSSASASGAPAASPSPGRPRR